ncbi:MAG: membrane protein insertion efficiency factor YidD [Acidobacteria bacterium]|nr:membrane protein insertion efficiency factor YidD [Acidobacteriota bacterium]
MLGPRYNRRTLTLCRFHPYCSEYAALAFRRFGIIKGGLLTINRMKLCNIDNTESTVDFP